VGCQAQSQDNGEVSEDGPFRTSVTATPGVCNLVDGANGPSGSWVVNCAGNNNDGDGSIFFCSDGTCSAGCQEAKFDNEGDTGTDVACINIPGNPPNGAQSFRATCKPGSRADQQQKDAENTSGAAGTGLGLGLGLALGAAVFAL
jgi:hypothetical protein